MIRHKIILLAGDCLAGIVVLILLAGTSLDSMPAWSLYFIPLALVFSFLCEVYLPEQWSLKERLLRSALAQLFTLIFILILPGGHVNALPGVFEFIKRLGSGYFGEVWKVNDTGLNSVRLRCIPKEQCLYFGIFLQASLKAGALTIS